MYAQTAEGLPGVDVRREAEEIEFSFRRFERELASYAEMSASPEHFTLSEASSATYHRFLDRDLGGYAAIRGQITGPVSFGFRVVDQNRRPIIYDDGVRTVLFDFVQRKLNAQYEQLTHKHENAFVWVDEPGLGWVLSGLSGYSDVQAREDYQGFLDQIKGPRALHLCADINLPYLFELGFDLVSFDAYQMEFMPREYARSAAAFLQKGGIIAWGIVPTDSESLHAETVEKLVERLENYWDVISRHSGLDPGLIARGSLIAPARCCLKNVGRVGAAGEESVRGSREAAADSIEERLVEEAFVVLREVSAALKEKYIL